MLCRDYVLTDRLKDEIKIDFYVPGMPAKAGSFHILYIENPGKTLV
jgi:hypothetical protein